MTGLEPNTTKPQTRYPKHPFIGHLVVVNHWHGFVEARTVVDGRLIIREGTNEADVIADLDTRVNG